MVPKICWLLNVDRHSRVRKCDEFNASTYNLLKIFRTVVYHRFEILSNKIVNKTGSLFIFLSFLVKCRDIQGCISIFLFVNPLPLAVFWTFSGKKVLELHKIRNLYERAKPNPLILWALIYLFYIYEHRKHWN